MAYTNQQPQAAQPGAGQTAKVRPQIKIYRKDSNGKKIDGTEIAFWENVSKKDGKKYLTGRDRAGNKFVGFFSE